MTTKEETIRSLKFDYDSIIGRLLKLVNSLQMDKIDVQLTSAKLHRLFSEKEIDELKRISNGAPYGFFI